MRDAKNDCKAPLPWQRRKSLDEDPRAHERIEAITSGPGYEIAEKDSAFLEQHETLGIRLELDYLKAELLLQKHGIEHTIVVFGSTRIIEETTARRQLEALKSSPDACERAEAVEIAERILEKSRYYEIARRFGRLVGSAGAGPADSRITLMTGGGPGIMEAANRGAFDVAAKSIGLNISLPEEQFPNPYVTPDLCFQFHYFAIRKLHFLQRAKALVFFPGGFGTLDELFGILTLIQTRKIEPVPIVLVGETYWKELVNMEFMEKEGSIDPADRSLFSYGENAGEIWEDLLAWHRANGTPLF
ncbi:LOG family protein [Sulfurimonas sp. HSL3-7]|uniref:LOG family protein n=1 Tax=Sulfonitrofixus jiaomeiensis TaxID=3131938 RepID=UPI0031F8A248